MSRTDGDSYTLTNGSGADRDTAGSFLEIGKGEVLVQVSVNHPTSQGPIRVRFVVDVGPHRVYLKAGWARGEPGDAGVAGLRWEGEYEVPDKGVLGVFARNNTGATVTVDWNFTVR